MANSYTKAAFGLTVTAREAELMRQTVLALDIMSEPDTSFEELAIAFYALGSDFAKIFPSAPESPFDGVLDILSDINHPSLGFDLSIGTADPSGMVEVYVSGDSFDAEVAANLLQRVAKSALPFGFEFSYDCDRLRAGEFGGGYAVITDMAISFGTTAQLLGRALARTRDEGADGFVLATRNAEHGLSFWNREAGFARLADAKVFSEAEASTFDKPIADDEPEWLAMPPPLL